VARDFGGKLLPAYLFGERQLASSLPADLILIDGPPLALGGREGTLYQLLDRARPGTIVLLDDASRAAERAIVRRWLDNLDEAIEASYPEGFARGLAAIIVRQPVPSATLWDRKLEMTRRQIEKIVPVGGMFVLVDQNYWSEPFAGGRHDVPLVERDGVSWGPPESDDAAMTALRIHRDAGASHLVLLWTAYWWLESYQGFLSVLRTRHELVLENDRLLVFRL
jgi:hypothetical protein